LFSALTLPHFAALSRAIALKLFFHLPQKLYSVWPVKQTAPRWIHHASSDCGGGDLVEQHANA
jgi:hypothetical protein